MKTIVSLVGCDSYERDKVRKAVRESVNLVGGMGSFVKSGQRVLLKVNLLMASEPEKQIVTHPAVVRAVAELVQEAGGKVVIGDSPSGPFNKAMLKRTYEKAGLVKLAEELEVELNYDTNYSMKSNPKGRLLKAMEISDYVSKADVIISLPKLKTHAFMQFTGATKIMFGAIPGVTKVAYHSKLKTPQDFAEMLIDLLELTKPTLSIMDAVVGMDGNGPSAGGLKDIGVIMASPDSVALDVVAVNLVGMNPDTVPPLSVAKARGLTSGKLEDLEVLGGRIEDFKVRDFKKPPTAAKPNIIMRMVWGMTPILSKHLIMYPISTDRCVRCGVCRDNCPVQAITIKNRAVMDYGRCIRCYCCHETCPNKAIELRKPLLGRIIK